MTLKPKCTNCGRPLRGSRACDWQWLETESPDQNIVTCYKCDKEREQEDARQELLERVKA